jgi:hypothetical protein
MAHAARGDQARRQAAQTSLAKVMSDRRDAAAKKLSSPGFGTGA